MIAQLDQAYLRTRPWKLWSRLISYALFEGRPVTTRGQWINPIVFAHLAVEKRLPQFKKVEKPVFILGTGRSGSTVLGMVLSMHHRVGFLNEPKAVWHAIYPDEDLNGSYSRGIAKYRLSPSEASPERIKNAHRIFGAYLAASFSARVVDKYPELIFRIPFVKKIFPDARFLFLVRNGWDTCQSIEDWSRRLGKYDGDETHDWWGVNRRKWNILVEQLVPEHRDFVAYREEMLKWTRHIDMAAVEWIITMREGLSLMEEYPYDMLRVTYEGLCAEPKKELEKIANFIDLDINDTSFIKYGVNTLKPIMSRKQFLLNSAIKEPFIATMRKLNYEI